MAELIAGDVAAQLAGTSTFLDLFRATLASHTALIESMQCSMTLFSQTLQTPLHGTSSAGVVLQNSVAHDAQTRGTHSGGTAVPVLSTTKHAVAFADTSPALPPLIAVPPKQNKNEVRANSGKDCTAAKTQEKLLVPGLTIWVGNLPAGATYK